MTGILSQVLDIARRINGDGLSDADRANAAVTYVMDSTGAAMPLADQRTLLHAATDALGGAAAVDTVPGETVPTLPTVAPMPAAETAVPPAPTKSHDTAGVIHRLSGRLDFAEIAALREDERRDRIHAEIVALSEAEKMHLNRVEIADLVRDVLADMLGLGPLEALLADETITDIMVNGPRQVYVERHGRLERTAVTFRDDAHVTAVARRIVSDVGRRIDEAQPMVDARLRDGSRVNVAIAPLAIDGTTITIRKFPSAPMALSALVERGSLSAQMAGFLGLAAALRLNVLVSGGTGSGKTTLLNAMSGLIPEGERLVTIEDAAELRFQQPHVVRFETRPPNVEGTGEVTMRTLVRNALRMRPDRIILGEIRGDEVLDLLQAMNTGHDGSMTTLHANSPREAVMRVESMAALAGFDIGSGVVRRQLAEAVQLIVQVSRMRDGVRRVTSISEVTGIEGDAVTLQDLFVFEADATSTREAVVGSFRHTGYRPRCTARAEDYGRGRELAQLLGAA